MIALDDIPKASPLGAKVKSDTVYQGIIISLWRIDGDIQAFIQWRDTSGIGWGAPKNVWLISELLPDGDGYKLPPIKSANRER